MLQSIYTHAGCDYGCLYTYSPRHCFNPHTHAGCDNVHNVSGASFPVSIHTPTQGVTFLYICNVFRICFNPHTHAGCDNPLPRLTRVHNRFNPHTHAGCDSRSIIKITESKVSIHTPTQGVTMVVYTRIHLVIVSIHTPTQGVTTSIMYPAQASQFQSTHPRRVWPFCTFAMCSEYVSIHTPTQGVTIPCPVWRGCIIVSIHTPTQGVTLGQ